MRDQLAAILAELGAALDPGGAHAVDAGTCWRRRLAGTPTSLLPLGAGPDAPRVSGPSPQRARFAALPGEVRAVALARLEAWTHLTLGTLDTCFSERWASS